MSDTVFFLYCCKCVKLLTSKIYAILFVIEKTNKGEKVMLQKIATNKKIFGIILFAILSVVQLIRSGGLHPIEYIVSFFVFCIVLLLDFSLWNKMARINNGIIQILSRVLLASYPYILFFFINQHATVLHREQVNGNLLVISLLAITGRLSTCHISFLITLVIFITKTKIHFESEYAETEQSIKRARNSLLLDLIAGLFIGAIIAAFIVVPHKTNLNGIPYTTNELILAWIEFTLFLGILIATIICAIWHRHLTSKSFQNSIESIVETLFEIVNPTDGESILERMLMALVIIPYFLFMIIIFLIDIVAYTLLSFTQK